MRVVVDTNVFVSAMLNNRGTPARVVQAWYEGAYTLVVTDDLLFELSVTLARPRLATLISASSHEIREFVRSVEHGAEFHSVTETLAVSDDPDDDRVLEAAVAAAADYIVSGDRDLLRLGDFRGIQVVTPAQFATLLELE